MKIRLVLDGKKESVMAAVSLCLEAGVLSAMQTVDETGDLPELPKVERSHTPRTPKAEILSRFTVGTPVVVWNQRQERPDIPKPGTTGKVYNSRMSGRGVSLEVEFDDGELVKNIPSSMMRPV